VDLTPAYLTEDEMKNLRRRMKKSYQWIPTPSCIKKELQMNNRWPPSSVDDAAKRKRKLAKLKLKQQQQLQKLNRYRAIAARKREEKKSQQLKNQKVADARVRYTIPVAADEPTYCYCGDVSYGEMIACENEVSTYMTLLMLVLFTRVVSSGVCRTGCSAEREMVLSGL
jgi:hypothetical protein